MEVAALEYDLVIFAVLLGVRVVGSVFIWETSEPLLYDMSHARCQLHAQILSRHAGSRLLQADTKLAVQ